MRLPEVAATWQSHGVSVVPIYAKNRPAVRWSEYQVRCPRLDEVSEWWGNGHEYGIAIICGAVSGNLEMTEIEARALTSGALTDIANMADSLGCGDVWDQLISGYVQQSPSGGMHLVYRISDHEVPGNKKIAFDRTGPEPLVLAETRGEGGYFVGAPSPGSCHPSGEGWLLASGAYGEVPEITWDQRCLVHETLRRVFEPNPVTSQPLASSAQQQTTTLDTPARDVAIRHEATLIPGTMKEAAPTVIASPGLAGAASSSRLSPADDWSMKTDWARILEPEGWTLHSYGADGERLWCRPGKSRSEGHGASTDYQGKPGLYVWSTSAGLETETPLSKFFILAHYRHGGDMSACATELKRHGFGTQDIANLTLGELTLPPGTVPQNEAEAPRFSFDDAGNAMRLHYEIQLNYRHVHEENKTYVYNGAGKWEEDYNGALVREWLRITEHMSAIGHRTNDEKLIKWATVSRNQARVNAAVNMLRMLPDFTVRVSELDQHVELINTANGEYNMDTKELQPHDPKHLMTRVVNAKYDPQAQHPQWTKFLDAVLPDKAMQRYVQQAVGYSLIGRSDARAFFIIYGPSGTGKSQFLNALEHVFGDYAGTAAEGTFRGGREAGNTNDLHGLRGKRLVTTSETAEGGQFNESLMKRLTGRDKVVSRDLYQSNVTWTPECAIWLATNHPPRFNSDDNAIWKRAKLIPFLTEFGTDAPELPDYARRFLYAEADGILNWILAGLHDYMEHGLIEPESVQAASQEQRERSDSVLQFLDDQIADGVLIENPHGTVRTRELYMLYEDWCRGSGERGLGSRRFANRLMSSGRAMHRKTNSYAVWIGIQKPGSVQPNLELSDMGVS